MGPTELLVSGNILPTLGTIMFYKKMNDLYIKHLNESLKKVELRERPKLIIKNNKCLLYFNIFV